MSHFDEHRVLHELKHYLPAQSPLKDFIHHNTLHAFQKSKFFDAIQSASEIFGYKVSLSLNEYRERYLKKEINEEVLIRTISDEKGENNVHEWKEKLLYKEYDLHLDSRVGKLRLGWKNEYKTDMDSMVHPLLFRVLCSYLDQGISIWNFPVSNKGFIASLRELERNSFTSFFRTARAKKLLLSSRCHISYLLKLLIGDESLYEHYLYDQQFAHQGWSGMVSAVEDFPETLLDSKKISLHDLIIFELLLEIDALDYNFGRNKWVPLGKKITEKPGNLFGKIHPSELTEILHIWQIAFEQTYYNEVLNGIVKKENKERSEKNKSFQVLFCIDDRSCSLRRYIEETDPFCETFGTPGFFGVEFFFQPESGKFYTKLCPAPVTPKFLIKEEGTKIKRKKDLHFTKGSHSLFRGWIIAQSLGFWSAFRLFLNIFRPTMSPATASSFRHMDKHATLTIENKNTSHKENNLQIGFTLDEMASRVEGLFKSIGMIENFSPIVYIVGHGSSSVNNPHFAAYDCGACSGRPGSVNARVMCYMANKAEVRELLKSKGIVIPDETQFIGGLHDTTRDEIGFFDEGTLNNENLKLHLENEKVFLKALDLNAKERSRRFTSINTGRSAEKIHRQIKTRSVSLFEPRPELNHATNAMCVVGRRSLTKNIFSDRRSFMNSFDYNIDPEGKYLLAILKAAAPVCGGINLEYFFSRTDNHKLGAGTKLPHNVMGLFGVANGIDGDLRPGLPSQMIEMHDPVRLLIIVEHFPDVTLNTIKKNEETYEWFINDWVNLIVIHPENKKLFRFKDGEFIPYSLFPIAISEVTDIKKLVEAGEENLSVHIIN